MSGFGDLPAGYRAEILGTIDSTNEEARRRAEAGEPGGLFILAREQTAGRGRRGRSWESPRGNFHATLLLRPSAPPARTPELSFVAANAAADTLEALGAAHVTVKWPNDVLIAGAKAAGLLLESSAVGSTASVWVAIGFGIDLAHAPKEALYPATSLAAHTGRAPDPADVLPILARAWDAHYRAWERQGFAPVRAAWLARAAFLGERIRVRLGDGEVEGRIADIGAAGALVLETEAGRREVTAGEVVSMRRNV